MASITKTYDVALKALLYSRFKTILGIDGVAMKYGVIQCQEEIALREFAERRGDNWLDFISFYRSSQSPSWERQRTVLARRGVWLAAGVNVTAQPIDLNYDVTFWSKDLDKLYEIVEKYITWQHDFPKIVLTYLDTYTIEPDLHFGDITDQSTYSSKYETGTIFAYRVPIKIDGWILTSETVANLIEKVRLSVYNGDDVTDYSEIYLEDSSQDTTQEAIIRFFRRSIYGISSASITNSSVIIDGDRVSDFTVAEEVIIQGSTANNGLYIIASVTLDSSGDTVLVFDELITDATADGYVHKDE